MPEDVVTTEVQTENEVQTNDYADVKYFSQLDKETASNKEIMDSVKDYKTVADLVKAHAESKGKLKNALFMPGENATAEETKAFFQKLGVPESADGYELGNGSYNEKDIAELKNMFRNDILYRNAVTKKQGEQIWDAVVGILSKARDENLEKFNQYKSSFNDRYDAMLKEQYQVDSDRKAAINEDMDYLAEFIKETGLGQEMKTSGALYNPKVIHALAQYHKNTRGQGVMGSASNPSGEDTSTFSMGEEFAKVYGGKR